MIPNTLKKTIVRPFYGWYIVAVGFLSFFVGIGATIDALALLVKPMSESLGWTRTSIMGGVTVSSVVTALVSPFVGRIIDIYGARVLMTAGAIAGGGLLLAISRVDLTWQFYLLFGVGIGIARPCLSLVAPSAVVSNWFIVKRGRALALATMGTSLSAVALLPFTQYVITEMDWRAAWIMLGLVTWILLILPAAVIIRRRPEDMGLNPDGIPGRVENDEPKSQAPEMGAGAGTAIAEENWTAGEAIRTRLFWLMLLSMLFTAVTLMGVWMHTSANFTDQGISPGRAAIALGSVGLTSGPSRLFWGMLSEKLHIRYCIIITNLGLAASVLLIMLAETFPTALVSIMVFGVFAGGAVVFRAMVWPEYFGRFAVGSIQGVAELFRVIGGAMGPLLAGIVYDITRNYYPAFIGFSAACMLGALFMYLARPSLLPIKKEV
jgi:MFS family permease